MAQARRANQEFWDWVSFARMLSGANAFEISDIQEDETERSKRGNQNVTRLHWVEKRRTAFSENTTRNLIKPAPAAWPVCSGAYFEATADEMVQAARDQGLEGVIAKRKDGRYEGGKRNGSWVKYRLNAGQELVIGGYVPGPHGLDSIIVGYYTGQELTRVRHR